MCDCDLQAMLTRRDTLMLHEYDLALDLLHLRANEEILDVATGSGRMLSQIVKRGCQVISGDINAGALDRAKERLKDQRERAILVILDAHKLQFSDNSFNVITFANAIHEFENPRGALGEITRVLKADGKLLVVEFNDLGFELMEYYHQSQGMEPHRTGEMSTEDIDNYLQSVFHTVQRRDYSITNAWVCSGKKGNGADYGHK